MNAAGMRAAGTAKELHGKVEKNLGRLVGSERLEAEGLAAKKTDRADKRGVRIEVTARGRALMMEGRRRRLELSASALILVHNHPSGDPTPSGADVDMTREIVNAARPMRIAIHDHLVVGRDGVASFKALGLM